MTRRDEIEKETIDDFKKSIAKQLSTQHISQAFLVSIFSLGLSAGARDESRIRLEEIKEKK